MKGIEFVFLAIGAVAGAFLRYKLVESPLIIEVMDEQSKLEPLLPQIKRMVADNGIVTLHEVNLL